MALPMMGPQGLRMETSRRDLVKQTGALMIGAGFAAVAQAVAQPSAATAQKPPALPWPFQPVDPVKAAQAAYDHYYAGGCMFATFEGVTGQLRETIGYPYTSFPTYMLMYGEAGVADTATLCGALNGAAAAIYLMAGGIRPERKEIAFAMIRELFTWYEQTELPDFEPEVSMFDIVKSVAHSPLCHASITNWCKAAKVKTHSPERAERCAWLCGSVARQTIKLLNENAKGSFKPAAVLSTETQTCRSCHNSELDNTRGSMECGSCHFTPPATHSKL